MEMLLLSRPGLAALPSPWGAFVSGLVVELWVLFVGIENGFRKERTTKIPNKLEPKMSAVGASQHTDSEQSMGKEDQRKPVISLSLLHDYVVAGIIGSRSISCCSFLDPFG